MTNFSLEVLNPLGLLCGCLLYCLLKTPPPTQSKRSTPHPKRVHVFKINAIIPSADVTNSYNYVALLSCLFVLTDSTILSCS